MRRTLCAAALAVALAGCGSRGPAPRPSAAWSGLGARLSDWLRAHPQTRNCASPSCYGALVTQDGQPQAQFSELSTDGPPGFRVDAYQQALDDRTTLRAARIAVAAVLPPDTRTDSFRVVRGRQGCVLWTLHSASLARWFHGRGQPDASGTVAVTLQTLDSTGSLPLDRDDVNYAAISLVTAGPSGPTC
jgi:hypothetical protein